MTNPYVQLTNEAIDYEFWERGVQRGGGELGFLRELHSLQTLTDIRTVLQKHPGPTLRRVSSIWLDKYPICKPTPASGVKGDKRELGDLALLVRQFNGSSWKIRMWILQGKLASHGWQSLGSSPKEIELLEKCPEFELFRSANSKSPLLGTFDLLHQCFTPPRSISKQPFWSFLLFEPKSSSRVASTSTPSHIRFCLPGKKPLGGFQGEGGATQCFSFWGIILACRKALRSDLVEM